MGSGRQWFFVEIFLPFWTVPMSSYVLYLSLSVPNELGIRVISGINVQTRLNLIVSSVDKNRINIGGVWRWFSFEWEAEAILQRTDFCCARQNFWPMRHEGSDWIDWEVLSLVEHGSATAFRYVIFGELERQSFFERVFEDGLSFFRVGFQKIISSDSAAVSGLGMS